MPRKQTKKADDQTNADELRNLTRREKLDRHYDSLPPQPDKDDSSTEHPDE